MSLDAAAAAVADGALRAFVAALRTRDPEAILALFTDNASVFGSEDSEVAIGSTSLRAFVRGLCGQSGTLGWSWQVTAAGRDGDVVWFVAPGVAELTADDGAVTRVDPYRLSGVLRRTPAGWRFELFNGSEPTLPA